MYERLTPKTERKTLLTLPFKVGERVRVLCDSWGGDLCNLKTTENGKYLIGEIVCIIIAKQRTFIKIRAACSVERKRCYKRYPISAIGITVFLN